MPKWAEVKARWAWLNEHLADDEPVLFKLPRREAKKRIANSEKRSRIVVTTDPTTYTEFHAMREAYMQELHENPTLFGLALVEALKEFNVRGWYEQQQEQQETLGDA